jgi:opacity protein-like surface antigen
MSASGVARAEANGWYVGAEGGLNAVPKLSWTAPATGWTDTQNTDPAIIGQIGYGFRHLRVEGEVSWRDNGVRTLNNPDATIGNFRFPGVASLAGPGYGDMSALALMANAYYDFATGTRFTPYLGAGGGGARIGAHHISSTGIGVANTDRTAPAWQAMAGVSYALTSRLSIKAEYRYFHTGTLTLAEENSYATGDARGTYQAQNLLLGLRYTFQQSVFQ